MIQCEKIRPLKQAIQEHIRPGMSIHISDVFSFPIGSMMELTRQFFGTDARFTLIVAAAMSEIVPLLAGGCVKKVIHSFAGQIYPTAGPNPSLQEYFKSGKVDFERWSMLALTLRLAAAAMNVGYLPTRSLVGSDIGKENHENFKVIPDPFGEEEPMGVIKALAPDISIIHGLMGDPLGNTIISPLSVTAVQGVFASKKGAVVTVEKIVPTEVLRKYSHQVKIPSYLVKSITELPFGAHPWCMLSPNIEEVEGYDYDYDFIVQGRENTADLENIKSLIQKWIRNCPSHEDYLDMVGRDRLAQLKESYRRTKEQGSIPLRITPRKTLVSFTPQEIRIYAVTMKIAKIMKKRGYPLLVAGIGIGNLASWIAKELLKREGIHFDVAVDTGIIGYEPQPGDPFIFSLNTIFAANILTGVNETYTQYFQKGRNRTLGVLGSGQIDKFGNLNSTFIPPDIYLPGSGGANDVASYSDETLVTMPQSSRRFVDQVPYITCPGDSVRTLISDLGVFEKPLGEKEFLLTEYFEFTEGCEEKECVRAIQEKCGWDVKVAPELKVVSAPPPAFMDVLNAYDPEGHFREGFV